MSVASELPWSNAVVTGGLGFIGSNITRRIVENDVEVHVVDAELPEYGSNRFNLDGINEGITVHTGDVRNREFLSNLFERISPDAVFHFAAQLSRPVSMDDPGRDIDINCNGTVNLLEAVNDHCPQAEVLFTSSQAVYGVPASLPLSERTRTTPIDIYGANKLAAESYCDVYQQVHGLDTTVVRLTNVYGPRAQLANPNYGVINKFIRKALSDEELTVFEPGTMERDFVFIDDVVDGILHACLSDASGETYLIGSEKSIPITELAHAITDVAGNGEVSLVEWPTHWEGIRVGDISVSTAKLRTDTEWESQVNIRNGLERTLNYYEHNLEEYV